MPFTLLHASYIMPNEYDIYVGINIYVMEKFHYYGKIIVIWVLILITIK